MNTNTIFDLTRLTTLSLLIGSLVACGGGGGGGSTSSTPPAPVTLQGKVIDGYIKGALVCLDINGNNKCDLEFEPHTTSLEGGAYTLPAYTGSIAGLRVIAEVGADAIDEDDGQKIGAGNTYSLLAPAAASSTVTPFSTMVSSTIAAGGGESQVSIGQAMSNVAVQTGIAVDKLIASDYVAKNDVATAKIAQVAATAIAQVTNNLRNNAEIKAAGLTDGQIIKQANQLVQEKVLAQVVSAGKVTETAGASAAAIKAAVTAAVANANLSGVSLTGSVQNIIVATKSGNGSVVQMRDVLEEGIVIAQQDSGDYIDGAGKRVDGSYRGYDNALKAEFLRTSGGKLPPYKQLVYLQDKWFDQYEGSSDWGFNGSSWEKKPGQDEVVPESMQPTYSENCILIPDNRARTVSSRYCAVQKDLSNRKIAEFIPGYCEGNPKKLSTCENATFPVGSFAYDLTQSTESTIGGPLSGSLKLWVSNNDDWKGYCTKDNQDGCVSNDGTIFDFINWVTVRTGRDNNYQSIGDCGNTPFRIQSYNSANRKGIINWSSRTDNCNGGGKPWTFKVLESSDFEVVNVGGKDVMITSTPAILYANNPGDNEPFRIFAVHENEKGVKGVWPGVYSPINFKMSIPFTGDIKGNSQIMNKTTFDAILKQVGYTPFPYEGSSSSGTYRK